MLFRWTYLERYPQRGGRGGVRGVGVAVLGATRHWWSDGRDTVSTDVWTPTPPRPPPAAHAPHGHRRRDSYNPGKPTALRTDMVRREPPGLQFVKGRFLSKQC